MPFTCEYDISIDEMYNISYEYETDEDIEIERKKELARAGLKSKFYRVNVYINIKTDDADGLVESFGRQVANKKFYLTKKDIRCIGEKLGIKELTKFDLDCTSKTKISFTNYRKESKKLTRK